MRPVISSVGVAVPRFAGDFYIHPDALSARLPSFVPRADGGASRFTLPHSDWERRSPHLVQLRGSVDLEAPYSDSEKLALGQKLFPAMDELQAEVFYQFKEIAAGRGDIGGLAAWLYEQKAWFERLKSHLRRDDLKYAVNALLYAFFSSTAQPLFASTAFLDLLQQDFFDRSQLKVAAQGILNSTGKNVESRKRFLVGKNGFLVSNSRYELADQFIKSLTEGTPTLSWERDRFMIKRPLRPSPFDKHDTDYFHFLSWPVDPAHPLVDLVLEMLGWDMNVTVGKKEVVIALNFGASIIIEEEPLTVKQWRSFLPASILYWYLALPEKLRKYMDGELNGFVKRRELGRFSPQQTMALLLVMALKQYFLALGAQELSPDVFEEAHPLLFETIRRIDGALEARREALKKEVFGEDQFFAALGNGDVAGGRDVFQRMIENREKVAATHIQNGLAWLEAHRQLLSTKVSGVIARLHAYLQENAIPEVIGAFLEKEAAEILRQLELLQRTAKDLERLGASSEDSILKQFVDFYPRLRSRQLTPMMGTAPLLKTAGPKVAVAIQYLLRVFGVDEEAA